MPKAIKSRDLSVLTRHTDVPPDSAPMGDTTVNVFTLGEVAEILQAPTSRIKNWTIGRPFKIVPKVRAFRGKGSRNLYSMQDVYLLALVNQLHNDGFSNRVIERVVEDAALQPKLGPIHGVFLHRFQGNWAVSFSTSAFDWDEIKRMAADWCGFYLLHFKGLVNQVNERVMKLQRGV